METLDSYVLTALVGVPFVWGVLLAFLPGHRLQHIRMTSAAVAAVLMALTAYVFLAYDHEAGDFQLTREIAWLDSLGITFLLGVDGISVPMILLTGIVGLTGVLVSWTVQDRAKEFFVLFFLLVAGVYGVFVSLDLFFFFFFYELAVMPMYLLIGVWGSSSDFGSFLRPKEYGAMKLMLYLVAGSILVWVALMAVYVDGGIGSFSLVELREVTFSVGVPAHILPAVHDRVRRAGGPVALPHLVAGRPRGGADGGEHAARRRADEAGRLRHHTRGHRPAAAGRGRLDAGPHHPGYDKRGVRRHLRDGAARPEVRHRLLQRQPHGLRAHGLRHTERNRSRAAPCSRCSRTA